MKSHRALLSALLSLLNALVALVRGEDRKNPRPAQGPAHPWAYAHAAASSRDQRPHHERAPAVARRPARVAPPAHILALLANAPAIEPEFAPRPRAAPFAPFRRLAAHVRIYNPRPRPTHDARPSRAPTASLPQRVARVLDPITRWIVTASPARRVRAGAIG